MKSSKKITVTTGEILYCFFFGTLLFAKGIGLYDGQLVFKLVLVFATACFILKIAIEKYTPAEMVKMLAVILLTGITYLTSGEKGLLLYGMMVAGMKYVNVKRVLHLGAVLWTIAFFGITVSSMFHMEDTVYKVHEKLGIGHIFRWSLGYPHPNVLQVSYVIFAIFIIYCLEERFKIKHAFLLLLGGLWVFLYSVSYTGIIVLICLLAGRLYLYFRKKLNLVEKVLLQCIFPLCVVLSLVAPVTLKGKAFDIVNKVLSTRLLLGKLYLIPENISLFGTRYSVISNEVLTLDNSYLFAFIIYGIIPFMCLSAVTFYMIYFYLKRDRYLEVLIMITIVAGGVTEPFLYNTSFRNLSFLFMGKMLFEISKPKRVWGFLPTGISEKLNREIKIGTDLYDKIREIFKKIFSFAILKAAVGVVCAVIFLLAVRGVASYPEGYVVYRDDCAGLTKEIHYYDENDILYRDYKKMEDFQPGDEIEYFTGNIVKMEKMRNVLNAIFLGFSAGYILAGGSVLLIIRWKNAGK